MCKLTSSPSSLLLSCHFPTSFSPSQWPLASLLCSPRFCPSSSSFRFPFFSPSSIHTDVEEGEDPPLLHSSSPPHPSSCESILGSKATESQCPAGFEPPPSSSTRLCFPSAPLLQHTPMQDHAITLITLMRWSDLCLLILPMLIVI